MNGYFNGLMRMTGISFGRGDSPQPPVSTGIDTLQPLHVEETHVVEAPAPAPSEAPASVPAPGSAQGTGSTTRSIPLIPDRVDVKDQPGISQDITGAVESAANVETGPGSPGTSPLEKEHTRTITMSRTAGTHPLPPDPVQSRERPGPINHQPGTGHGQVNEVEAEGESKYPAAFSAIESRPKETVKPGQPGTKSMVDTIVEIVPGYKGKKEKIAVNKETATAPQQEGGLAMEDVLRWVTEPPLKVEAAVKESVPSPPPNTAPSQTTPLQDNREFNLSIGTISITVEEPQTGAEVMKNPPTQPPPDSGQDRNVSGEALSSRLGRHYLRMRG